MLDVDPEREPFELVLLTAERADMLKLLAQTERRAAVKRAGLVDDDAEPRVAADRPAQWRSRNRELTGSVWQRDSRSRAPAASTCASPIRR
jgi:hypothetical protein